MTCQRDPEIRRCTDGTIDFTFYDSQARRLRGEAIQRFPFQVLALQAHGLPNVADHVSAAINSVMMTLATVRHAMASKLFKGGR